MSPCWIKPYERKHPTSSVDMRYIQMIMIFSLDRVLEHSCKMTILMVRWAGTPQFFHVPLRYEAILRVSVHCVAHVSMRIPCKQIHQPENHQITPEPSKPRKNWFMVDIFYVACKYLGSSSLTTDLTKDKKSLQKFIQTVGFQQLNSFYRIKTSQHY